MTEDKIVEYTMNRGKLFTITLIDIIRDGGTILIKTTKDNIYLNRDYKDFHTDYPLTPENLITDPLTINYIIHLMNVYLQREEDNLLRNKNIVGHVIVNNKNIS